ncbi:WD40 repeat-like protein [Pseudovirgaria hyperparasitica]|uniref:WD40 repeat-like protein n=1 Tax=Pseudovirgaria hyperparasitica TaxID=470096 RepID=A0A6A6VZE8_9PEZI|nr:WD40 repeat-like protein [Pseudovirgaria hyperparasitica]KAF2755226.1 WD40 repeat-like protein [Pseudovirgaria hyperparasitica]
MPFHHHQQQQQQQQHGPSSNTPAAGIYQAARALGSIGAPTGNLRSATSGQTAAGTDSLLPSSGNAPGLGPFSGGSTPALGSSQVPGPSASAPANNPQPFETPRRTNTIGRGGEELHISTGPGSMGQHHSAQQGLHTPQQHGQAFDSPQQFAGGAPNISLQQATPQGNQYVPSQPSPGGVPGSLQPAGGNQRPGPSSAYTAPTTVPTMPQVQTNAQQYTLPTRSNTINQSGGAGGGGGGGSSSHTYSRSSPAGLEQKYIPFSNTPENAKLASTPSRYYPQTPSGALSQSPLGLADIRPRAGSSLEDTVGPAAALSSDQTPSNSSYLAPWGVYAFDWCKWPIRNGDSAGKMAVGSYLEDPHNFIQILDTQIVPQDNAPHGGSGYGIEYTKVAEATCSYPVTRVLWEPPSSQKQSTDLLATSGDHLRLWSLPQNVASPISNTITRSSAVNQRDPPVQKLTPLALLSNSKSPEHTAPLTSLDWNVLSPKLIITSSIDTTCTIWDIPTLTAKTQLIAHDKEVFDVRFCAQSTDVFVSCGADGSVRMFDLRSLEHSTIIYEPSDKTADKDGKGSPAGRMSPTKAQQTMSYAPPLLRLAASPHESHLLATFAADSNLIRILDIRQPGQAFLELKGHSAPLNSIEWSPTRRGLLASGADDSLVLIWDLMNNENSASLNGGAAPGGGPMMGAPQQQQQQQQQQTQTQQQHPQTQQQHHASQTTQAGQQQTPSQKGPYASWRCDYEVGNLSWAPSSALTGQGGEWLGVGGGRGIWGVKI